MKLTLSTLALLFFVQLSFAQTADTKGVEKACMNYLDGFYEGDTTKLIASLKPTLYKYGYWKDKDSQKYEGASHMTFEKAIDYSKRVLAKNEFPHKNSIKEVEILDISNHTAAAKVTAWWGTDYMLLSREGDKWMIEQVLWEGPLDKKKKD